MPEEQSQWLTVSEASSRFVATADTIRRHARNRKLGIKKVVRNGREIWLVLSRTALNDILYVRLMSVQRMTLWFNELLNSTMQPTLMSQRYANWLTRSRFSVVKTHKRSFHFNPHPPLARFCRKRPRSIHCRCRRCSFR